MEESNKPKQKVVETYAEDMAKVIESGTGGLIRKVIRGEEENEKERQNLSPESKKNKLFMILGTIFIFLATAVLYYFVFINNPSAVPVEPQFTPLIFSDKSDFLEVAGMNKDEIVRSFIGAVNAGGVKQGGVDGIYLTENKKVIGLRRFMELIGGSFSPGSADLVYDNFLMGFVDDEAQPASTAGRDFFIILKMRSVADIFPSIRAWEHKMFADLHGFLGMDITSDTGYLLTKDFEDGIVQNKNARILYTKDGKTAVMYVFADDNSIIITTSSEAAREIMLRLAQNQGQN